MIRLVKQRRTHKERYTNRQNRFQHHITILHLKQKSVIIDECTRTFGY